MDARIDQIIASKPHLADPLRFYEKVLRFTEEVRKLPVSPGPGQVAYPPELAVRILDSLSTMLDLPEGTLSPLKQAFELREIDFTRLPLREVPAFSLPYAEEDLTMLLFLVSRPYFLALREASGFDGSSWEEGKCPVCNAQPAFSALEEDGRKQLHCSFCGASGSFTRAQCPICRNLESAKSGIFTFAGEEGFSVQTCDECQSYLKIVEPELLSRYGTDLTDLMSLPLDMVIQQKGYKRRSPNPLGMMNMSTSG